MAPSTLFSLTNPSLISGFRTDNCFTKFNFSQNFLLRTRSITQKPRTHIVLSATDTDTNVVVAVEQPPDAAAEAVAEAGPPKRSRPVRKSEMPPVKNEELVPGASFVGKVRSIQPFGAFVDFGAYTDGLVHVSQLSDSYVKDVASVVTVGQEVEVRLVEANAETGRISLTMRKTDDAGSGGGGGGGGSGGGGVDGDKSKGRPPRRTGGPKGPQKNSKFVKGQDLEGTVKNMTRAGAFISLPEGEEGFLPTSEEAGEGFNLTGSSSLQIGQEVAVRVLRIARGQATLTMKKDEDNALLDSKLTQKVLFTATNPFLLAFRKNKDIAMFLDERERIEEAKKEVLVETNSLEGTLEVAEVVGVVSDEVVGGGVEEEVTSDPSSPSEIEVKAATSNVLSALVESEIEAKASSTPSNNDREIKVEASSIPPSVGAIGVEDRASSVASGDEIKVEASIIPPSVGAIGVEVKASSVASGGESKVEASIIPPSVGAIGVEDKASSAASGSESKVEASIIPPSVGAIGVEDKASSVASGGESKVEASIIPPSVGAIGVEDKASSVASGSESKVEASIIPPSVGAIGVEDKASSVVSGGESKVEASIIPPSVGAIGVEDKASSVASGGEIKVEASIIPPSVGAIGVEDKASSVASGGEIKVEASIIPPSVGAIGVEDKASSVASGGEIKVEASFIPPSVGAIGVEDKASSVASGSESKVEASSVPPAVGAIGVKDGASSLPSESGGSKTNDEVTSVSSAPNGSKTDDDDDETSKDEVKVADVVEEVAEEKDVNSGNWVSSLNQIVEKAAAIGEEKSEEIADQVLAVENIVAKEVDLVKNQVEDAIEKVESLIQTPAETEVPSPPVMEEEAVPIPAANSLGETGVPSAKESTTKGEAISPALVKQLRDETGAGMMDCKKALSETEGDIVKAQEFLRKKGLASADKKASRTTAEGRIGSYIHDNRIGILIEVNCETDFVSRGEIFKELVDDLAMQAAACPQVQYLVTEDVAEELVNKEREIEMQKEDLLSKPEAIREKIVEGRIRKRLEELALLEQPYIKNDKVVVKDWVKQTIATVGENIKVKRFVRFNLGEGLEKKSQDFAAEVAAQTAAKSPAPLTEKPAASDAKDVVEKPPTVAVSAALVKQLRDETGAGMMDCKKALAETEGDLEKAQEYLRKKGLSSADKKASRLAAEGRIGSYIHDSRIGVLIEVNCETDFVGRSEKFKELVDDLAMQVVACPQVDVVSIEDIPESTRTREKELEMQREDLLSKPENIREKIVEGRVGKRLGELALLEQPFVKDDSVLVKDVVKQVVAALGENIKVRRFVRFTLGEEIETAETEQN